MLNKKVSIIILNLQGRKYVSKSIRSVLSSNYLLIEVVMVDNGSTDGSVEMIKNRFTEVIVIENKQNLGFAKGNNIGINYALKKHADYIFVLNPDTKIEKDTIKNLLLVMEKNRDVGIVGPKIYTFEKRIWSCGGILERKRFSAGLIGFGEEDNGQYDGETEVDYISGAAMFVRRSTFEEIGLLPENYFLYYEDVEFSLRAKRAGLKVYFTPTAIVYHDWSSYIGKTSPMKDYYMARNHLLFVERNASWTIKLREFLRLPKTIYEYYRRNEKFALLGIRDYFLRRFGKRDYWS
jgi:GT2 family glycosyltransferase